MWCELINQISPGSCMFTTLIVSPQCMHVWDFHHFVTYICLSTYVHKWPIFVKFYVTIFSFTQLFSFMLMVHCTIWIMLLLCMKHLIITGLLTETSCMVLILYCIASFPFVHDNNWVYMWKYHIILMYLRPHHVKSLTRWYNFHIHFHSHDSFSHSFHCHYFFIDEGLYGLKSQRQEVSFEEAFESRSVSVGLTWGGSDATTAKKEPPQLSFLLRKDLGRTNKDGVANLSAWEGERPRRHLETKKRILKSSRRKTGSDWSDAKSREMCPLLLEPGLQSG